jgi:hypothetical protein
VIVPSGAGLLPTVKNQVERNASEAATGVGLGDGTGAGEGTGLGDGMGVGIGVGVGVGCILLETEPQPARNSKSPVTRIKATVRTKTSLESGLSFKKGNLFDSRRAAEGGRLSGNYLNPQDHREPRGNKNCGGTLKCRRRASRTKELRNAFYSSRPSDQRKRSTIAAKLTQFSASGFGLVV